MTKVEELKEKAEYSLVRDNGEKQNGYHFETPEKLNTFEQAVREEEGEEHKKSILEIDSIVYELMLDEYLNDESLPKLGKIRGIINAYLTQPTKEM
jgi:hypothetical protein